MKRQSPFGRRCGTGSRGRRNPWVLLLVCATVGVSSAADRGGLLDSWCAAQTNCQTWSAEFTQTRSLKALAQPLVTPGKAWVRMPNRFRWELGHPPQTIALRQPHQLWLIYPRLKRAEKYPLADASPGPWKDALALLEASFPRNRADLESRFHVVSAAQTNAQVHVVLQPKSASARKFMSEIQVVLRTNDFSLVSTVMQFNDGSRIHSEFTNAVLNGPMSGELFEARLDPEMTIVEPLAQ